MAKVRHYLLSLKQMYLVYLTQTDSWLNSLLLDRCSVEVNGLGLAYCVYSLNISKLKVDKKLTFSNLCNVGIYMQPSTYLSFIA